ncbi:hypothetical protein [Peribacillus asahii]|uniref:hypothetical protein n=1 Tax=Peribacillus asahii TaxID=228899 RepID=UPI00381235EE
MRGNFISFISILLCCFVLLLPFTASAHPGRTDSGGGHYCRTNCEQWGEVPGGYHYHNGGSSSGGSSSSSNSSSSGSTSESAPATSAPESEPKVDEDQVQADQYYKTANDLYNSADYQDAITELEKIYELNKSDSKTDNLVQKSVTAIYELAESAVSEGDYPTAKDHLDYIQEYQRSSNQIKQKANKLLEQIEENEAIEDLLSNARTARDENDYEETLSFIQQAQKIKDSEEIKSFYNETVESLTNDAEVAYQNKQYKQAKKLYKLLVKITATPKLKSQYEMTLQQIQDEHLLQESFEIDTENIKGNSLFNHLMEEANETPYNENVVNNLKSSLEEAADDAMHFIFNVNIKELFKGGKKDAA